MLNSKEILLILDLLKDRYGPGYSEDREVASLQAKLSIMLEVKQRMEEANG